MLLNEFQDLLQLQAYYSGVSPHEANCCICHEKVVGFPMAYDPFPFKPSIELLPISNVEEEEDAIRVFARQILAMDKKNITPLDELKYSSDDIKELIVKKQVKFNYCCASCFENKVLIRRAELIHHNILSKRKGRI